MKFFSNSWDQVLEDEFNEPYFKELLEKVDEEYSKWVKHIGNVLSSNDANKINDTINTLYMIRVNSIAADGEYGKGNQLFKALRSDGYIHKLRDKLLEIEDKELSLESLTKGQLVRLDL